MSRRPDRADRHTQGLAREELSCLLALVAAGLVLVLAGGLVLWLIGGIG
jgi:hypothetical protein